MSSNTTSGADADGRLLTIRPSTSAPTTGPVRHFDELPERAQELVAKYEKQGSIRVTPEVASLFADEPVIVFSEYLQVDLA